MTVEHVDVTYLHEYIVIVLIECSALAVVNCMPEPFSFAYLLCRDLVCPFTNRINIDPRKSPKLSRATQEISRSPRLPIRKPSIGSPSLTRREFPLDDITQVKKKGKIVILFNISINSCSLLCFGFLAKLPCSGHVQYLGDKVQDCGTGHVPPNQPWCR